MIRIMSEIDYSDTQLSDDEVREHMRQRSEQAARDDAKNRERWRRAKGFHFSGGML